MIADDEYLAELIKRDNTISYYKLQLESTTEKLESATEQLNIEKKTTAEKNSIILEYAKTLKKLREAC